MPSAVPGRRQEPGPGHPVRTVLGPDDMDLDRYLDLLRDAARASAISWGEPMKQGGHDRALRHLGIAVLHLQITVARLAGRLRLGAVARPGPARTDQVLAVTASTLALRRGWLLLADGLPAEGAPAYGACVPGDLLCFVARRLAAWQMPATGLEEIALSLGGALAALETGTACLAVGAAHPLATCLIEVRDCLQVAGSQLKNVPEPAAPPSAARGRGPGSR
jgi:hypothetical protein